MLNGSNLLERGWGKDRPHQGGLAREIQTLNLCPVGNGRRGSAFKEMRAQLAHALLNGLAILEDTDSGNAGGPRFEARPDALHGNSPQSKDRYSYSRGYVPQLLQTQWRTVSKLGRRFKDRSQHKVIRPA